MSNQSSLSENDTITRGRTTWFKGKPAHASDGTIALALNDDVRIIVNEKDVLEVKKVDDRYSVEVSAEATFLVRIEKLLNATPAMARRARSCIAAFSESVTLLWLTSKWRLLLEIPFRPESFGDSEPLLVWAFAASPNVMASMATSAAVRRKRHAEDG